MARTSGLAAGAVARAPGPCALREISVALALWRFGVCQVKISSMSSSRPCFWWSFGHFETSRPGPFWEIFEPERRCTIPWTPDLQLLRNPRIWVSYHSAFERNFSVTCSEYWPLTIGRSFLLGKHLGVGSSVGITLQVFFWLKKNILRAPPRMRQKLLRSKAGVPISWDPSLWFCEVKTAFGVLRVFIWILERRPFVCILKPSHILFFAWECIVSWCFSSEAEGKEELRRTFFFFSFFCFILFNKWINIFLNNIVSFFGSAFSFAISPALSFQDLGEASTSFQKLMQATSKRKAGDPLGFPRVGWAFWGVWWTFYLVNFKETFAATTVE